jgi:hypothetical protein
MNRGIGPLRSSVALAVGPSDAASPVAWIAQQICKQRRGLQKESEN